MDSKNYLLVTDAILLFGGLIAIFFLIDYTQPLVIAPIHSDSNNLIFTLPPNNYIIIDDKSKFDSPETIFVEDTISLEKGRYFIKFFNGLSSEIREINLETEANLYFKKLEDGSIGVFNVGDLALSVETYNIGSLVNSSLVYVGVDNE